MYSKKNLCYHVFLQKSHCSVFNHPPSNDNEKVGITFYANCNLCDYKSTANAWKVSMQDTPTPPPPPPPKKKTVELTYVGSINAWCKAMLEPHLLITL